MIKKIIKYLVSELLFIWKKYRIFGKPVYKILLYHSVANTAKDSTVKIRISPDDFRMQMQFLYKNGYNATSLFEMVRMIKEKNPISPKTLAITFDDGYRDFLENALPVLKEFDFCATLFVSPGLIDKKIDAGDIFYTSKILSWDELNLLKHSNIFFGSHGYSHRKLSGLDLNALNEELSTSKRRLEEELKISVDALSYPYGSFDNTVKETAKGLGYEYALTGRAGSVSNNSDSMALNRVEIMLENSSLREFKKKLYGCYDWLGIKRMFV